MGKCTYCGNDAGWFRSEHKECAKRAKAEFMRLDKAKLSSTTAITQLLARFVETDTQVETVGQAVAAEKALGALSDDDVRAALISGWGGAVKKAMEDGVLSTLESERLQVTMDHFRLTADELNRDGSFSLVTKNAVLREVLDGRVPGGLSLAPNFPVTLQRDEQAVWSFAGVKYLEDTQRRQWQGRSQGVSVRVMRGVYYRVGAFKGEPVFTTERKHVDTGLMLLTTKHLYFIGPAKTMRIPYAKIISFTPFSDAIGVARDAASAKPQFFVVDDPWFAYNLVVNLARMRESGA